MWSPSQPSSPGGSASNPERINLEARPRPGAPRTRWGQAIGLGFVVAAIGGLVWGVIAAFSGYVFGLAAIILGLLIAAAVQRGAGRATWGTIGLAVVLTLFAVFLGDVIGLTIAVNQAGYSVSIVDVLAAYPSIVALAPGETAIAYFFGFLGAGAGAVRLYREMKAPARSAFLPRSVLPGPILAPSGFAGVSVQTVTRSARVARARVTVEGPPSHVIDASFEATLGSVKVLLDGQLFRKTHIWGPAKVIQVPLPSHRVDLRFYGNLSPRIDVSLDGSLLRTV